MGRIEKTVFISYRRTNVPWALAIYQNLTMHGYDVFFDYQSIDSGNFEKVILENIKARAHFLVILTPSALERCKEPGDWLRREIETAMDEKRNIVPLMLDSFDFGSSLVTQALTGKLTALSNINGLRVYSEYFFEAMDKLRERYINLEVSGTVSLNTEAKGITEVQKTAASEAPQVEKEQLTAQEWLERGYLFAEEGNYPEAIRCYTESINLEPNDYFVYSLRGSAYNITGDLNRALADINNAIQMNPNFAEFYSQRGEIYREIGDLINSISDHDKAIQLKPDSAPAYELRGLARDDNGDYDGAISDYSEAIQILPDFVEAYTNRGLAYSNKGDLEEAIKDYNEALRNQPNHADAYHNRGIAHGRKGDFDRAIKDYNETIRLNQNYVSAYFNRAIAWEEKEEFNSAITDYQNFLSLGGGIAYDNQKEVEDLIGDLKKKIK
jgi:tetratricopeptide (TPR) repeat protein